MFIRLVKN